MGEPRDSSNANQASSPHRRSSFASQALADIFGTSRARPSFNTSNTSNEQNSGNPVGSHPGSVASSVAQAQQRRRMSLTGMAISPTTGAPGYNGFKRSDSVSSQQSGAIDEHAVEDGEPLGQASPTTPFARRMSFGARALRDVRTASSPTGSGASGGGTQANGRSPKVDTGVSAGTVGDGGKKTTPSSGKGRDSGYNWADNFRSRAERSASIASQGSSGSPSTAHSRAKSIATMQPPPVQPQPARQPMVPDHMQERILKGDFYMD